ncbi:MAG: DUF3445 domain-containing protein [Paracoccaceae bacterium]
MTPILQTVFPPDMMTKRALPGIAPVQGGILHVDDAYSGQMDKRRKLLATRRDKVLRLLPEGQGAALEVLHWALTELPALGYTVTPDTVLCPDGHLEPIDLADPLATLGRVCQADFCILQAGAQNEHVMTGAVLCFPASWTLSEKIGRSLTGIHTPVMEYDDNIARRVQRLFDGVQVGRPVWRFNQLWYVDAELHQPRSETDKRVVPERAEAANFLRTERQIMMRLPESRAVVFIIHTYVFARENVPE